MFTVIDDYTHKKREFDNANQVSIWLWGKNPDAYTIIKSRVLETNQAPRDLNGFQEFLEKA